MTAIDNLGIQAPSIIFLQRLQPPLPPPFSATPVTHVHTYGTYQR